MGKHHQRPPLQTNLLGVRVELADGRGGQIVSIFLQGKKHKRQPVYTVLLDSGSLQELKSGDLKVVEKEAPPTGDNPFSPGPDC